MSFLLYGAWALKAARKKARMEDEKAKPLDLKPVFPEGVPKEYADPAFQGYVKSKRISVRSRKEAEAALKNYRQNARWSK